MCSFYYLVNYFVDQCPFLLFVTIMFIVHTPAGEYLKKEKTPPNIHHVGYFVTYEQSSNPLQICQVR